MTPHRLSPKGLFGGLAHELRLDDRGLQAHVCEKWTLDLSAEILEDVEDWHRGGAETYVAHSVITNSAGNRQFIFAKAFVGWGPSPTVQQEGWERRRIALGDVGVRVPKLIHRYDAMSIEEYIPETVTREDLTPIHYFELGQIAASFNKLKLRPLAMLADVRLANDSIVYVDLGSDLIQDESAAWIEAFADNLTAESRQAFQEGFRSKGTGKSAGH